MSAPDPGAIRVAAIARYPVKSCRGTALVAALVERRGLSGDRRWMIVDPAGGFVTQREEPRLALVDVELDHEWLRLSAPGIPPLEIEDRRDEGREIEVAIWSDVVPARAHETGSAWASRYLGRPVHLVAMPDSTRRRVSPAYALPGDVVSFADGYPLLLASASSLDDLNARLAVPIGIERFRPNVVVTGAPPWAEDGWTGLRIGAVTFRAPKPCDRCVVVTIDPATATAGKEPLRTLATFRRTDRGVLFGLNLIPDLEEGATAEIRVGDPVTPIA